tara:strand:+ start:998 stop:1198 length:201 start_codon:yes stop_codon:yes gene_type:complete
MAKKKKIEVFNITTGKWELEEKTEQEIREMQKMEDNHFDILNAEFKIVQKSIEMQLGMYDKAKSKD